MNEDRNMGRNKENLDKWSKEKKKRFEFYINKEKDKDVYEYFETIPNKRQYLIDLIRGDMNEHIKPVDKKV